MFCNKCGNRIDNTEGVRFCNKCGNDLSASISSMNNVVTPQSQVINSVVDEPQVDLEKRRSNRNKLWITAIVCCVVWVFVVIGGFILLIAAMGNWIEEIVDDYNYQYNYDYEEDENEPNYTIDNEKEDEKKEVGKRVGSEEYGYITVPDNWYKFIDVDGNDTLQYTYANTYIATLYAIDTETADAETYAAAVRANIENQGATQVAGAQVTVAGYDGYQVYGYYEEENIWLVMWFFETDDGKTRYIAIEGPDAESEYFNIPDTFSTEE